MVPFARISDNKCRRGWRGKLKFGIAKTHNLDCEKLRSGYHAEPPNHCNKNKLIHKIKNLVLNNYSAAGDVGVFNDLIKHFFVRIGLYSDLS